MLRWLWIAVAVILALSEVFDIPLDMILAAKAHTGFERVAREPVFIAQGTDDDIVRPAITKRFADHLCRKRTSVHMVLLESASHSFAGMYSADTAVKWMSERFKRRSPPSDCRQP